jgi:hypothetical protein
MQGNERERGDATSALGNDMISGSNGSGMTTDMKAFCDWESYRRQQPQPQNGHRKKQHHVVASLIGKNEPNVWPCRQLFVFSLIPRHSLGSSESIQLLLLLLLLRRCCAVPSVKTITLYNKQSYNDMMRTRVLN